MPKTETKSLAPSLLVGGTGIALGSVTAYSLAAFYELGYATTFGIPLGLIRVERITIVTALVGLIFIGVILFGLANTVYSTLSERTGPVRMILIRQSPILIFYAAFLIAYRNVPQLRLKWFAIFALWLLLNLFTYFILPLITQRSKGTYREKLEAQEKADESSDPETLIRVISRTSRGLMIIRLSLLFGVLHLLSSAMGNAEALSQRYFLVPQDQANTVVLRIYDAKFICAPVDPKSKEIQNELILRENSAESPLRLIWTKVGPLKRKTTDGAG